MEKLFIPFKYKKKLSEKFMNKIAEVPFEKIGLFTTIQFVNQLKQLKEFLKAKDKEVFIGEPNYRATEKGQVLGCDITSPLDITEKVDGFIYLGSGYFHSISAAIKTNKPVFQANPTTEKINKLDEKEIKRYKKLKKRTISKAKKANIFGILVSNKPGQKNLKLAEKTKEKIEKKSKKAYIFMFETLNPNELLNFPDIEAWINTACPRIAVDDIERFDKPIVNWSDLKD